MHKYNTADLDERSMREMSPDLVSHIYNGLDCCVTYEIYETLMAELAEEPECVRKTYSDAMAKQAPFLEMSMRGLLMDYEAKNRSVLELSEKLRQLDTQFQRIMQEIFKCELNWNSHVQVKSLFYGMLGLKEIKARNSKGIWAATANEDALTQMMQNFWAEPLARYILAMKELRKKISFLNTGIDADGRFRTSLNVAGTDTGRTASSGSDFGTGSNLQNVDRTLRYPFISDPGYILVNVDLEQADARNLGAVLWNMFLDEHGPDEAGKFLDFAESGDLHTKVCKMTWQDLPWTGDPKADKKVAQTPFLGEDSYRDMAKKLGHGCLTADHEVLTPSGWVSIEKRPPVIMQWAPQGSWFAGVSNWTAFKYEGTMHSFEGTSISALMTPEHRIPYYKDVASGILHTKTAIEGPGHAMPLGFGYIGGNKQVHGKLIAAVMSDGELTGNKTRFHFNKVRKLARLIELCIEAGVDYTVHNDGRVSINFTHKKQAGAYMLDWEEHSAIEFLEEYALWDGHVGATSRSLFSVDRTHLEWIQTLGRLYGIGGNMQKSRLSGFGSIVHTLQQNNRKYTSGKSINVQEEQRSEYVYCPTVSSSWFYVRRNGKIFVTGNSNYMGQPHTMAKHTKTPVKIIESFQRRYFEIFPLIPAWHQRRIEEIRTTGVLTTMYGRRRHFFGRGSDASVHRAAIAYEPQSMTGHEMDMGILNLWRNMPEAQLLIQVHDSILFQVPYRGHADYIARALELLRFEHILAGGRKFSVPLEAKVGWNWGNVEYKDGKPIANQNGLAVWKGGTDPRPRPDYKTRLRDYF